MIQRDSLISELHDITSSNYTLIHTILQYYTYIPPILPDFLRLIARGSNTQLKEIGCHIPDSVHIVAISVRFSKKRRGKQLSMNSSRLWSNSM